MCRDAWNKPFIGWTHRAHLCQAMYPHGDFSNEIETTQASVFMNLTFHWWLGGLTRNEKGNIDVDSLGGENKARLGYREGVKQGRVPLSDEAFGKVHVGEWRLSHLGHRESETSEKEHSKGPGRHAKSPGDMAVTLRMTRSAPRITWMPGPLGPHR